MSKDLVYGNEFYEIYPNVEGNGYIIVNRMTSVVEGGSEVLPSAVSKADIWSELLKEVVERIQGVKDEGTDRQ
ncbi:MAG: hypothetical protein ACRC6V_12265 [Bacteroidales bacterium]